MSAERAASQPLCGRAEDSQVPHLLTLGRIFLVERAVRSCKGLLRGCLGAVGYAVSIMHYAQCTMHYPLCTRHYVLCTMHCLGAAGSSGGRLLDKCTTRYHDFPLILKYTLKPLCTGKLSFLLTENLKILDIVLKY